MKLNKTLMIAALAAGSVFAGNLTLHAQDSTNTPSTNTPPAGGMRGRGPGLDQIAKELDLSDDQKAKVKAAMDDQRQKMQDLRSDSTLSQDDRNAKRKEIRDAMEAKIKDILTPDQFAKWQKMMPAMRNRGGGRPPGAGSSSTNSP
jgi:Spy/CpxP family protein refolding chaperone